MGAITVLRAGLAGLVALVLLAAVPATALEVQELTSPQGNRYWLVEEPSIPIVALDISFDGGARLDPEGRAGLAVLFAGLLEEGSGELDSVGFAKARDALSARFRFSASRDSVDVSAMMLSDTLDPAAKLLAGALAAPRFDPEPLQRVRGQVLASIAESANDPGTAARDAWNARAFPDHPYGQPTDGTAESVTAITRDDLVAAQARLLTRANARIAVVGNIDAEQAGRMIDTVLGGIAQGEKIVPEQVADVPPPGVKVVQLDVPQSAATFGQQGLKRDDPDFIPAYVMNYILGGGGFASRLMEEVRVKRGLAYSVYSYLSPRDEAALYLGGVQTANARMAESLKIIKAEWARMARKGVTADELDRAKRYLTGAFPLRFDSDRKIARVLVGLQEQGLGSDYINRRNSLIEAVTVKDIRRVAARLLKPEQLSIVVAGKPAGL
jgi:zinc protease